MTVEELEALLRSEPSSLPKPPESPVRPPRSIRLRLGRAKIEEVVARYQAGETSTALAREFGVRSSGLVGLLRREGVQLRFRRLTDAELDRASALYQAGHSLSQVAENLRAQQESVRLGLIKRSVPMRPARRTRLIVAAGQ